MQLIDGKKIAAEIRAELKDRIAVLKGQGIEPGLATILVGENPASQIYVSSKIKACSDLGIKSYHHPLPGTATVDDVIELIRKLNMDVRVHGILLQLPLPGALAAHAEQCVREISPAKDVDGLHPYNIGQLCVARNWRDIEQRKLLVSCTPLGVIHMLNKTGIPIAGMQVVIVGRSTLFGKPAGMLFLANDATVTMAHSKTANLPEVCKRADIVVAAIGKAGFVTRDFIKTGAVVIDVGINRTPEGIKGDVDFEAVKDLTSFITPVPGGVGAMTITMLMRNTILAAE